MNESTPFPIAVLSYVLICLLSNQWLLERAAHYLSGKETTPVWQPKLIATLSQLLNRWGVRLFLLVLCYFRMTEYVEELQYNQQHTAPQPFTVEQLSTVDPGSIPRYVTISSVFPTETGALETKSRYFIPISKTYIYAALPNLTDSTGETQDRAGADSLRVFIMQDYKEGQEPAAGVARQVVGRYTPSSYLDPDLEKLFEDDGYTVLEPPVLIEEGELPKPDDQLYIKLGLVGLLALTQVVFLIRGWLVKKPTV